MEEAPHGLYVVERHQLTEKRKGGMTDGRFPEIGPDFQRQQKSH